jgi:hypothetical protein
MTRARTLADLAGQSLATDAEVTAATASKIGGDGSITSIVEVTQAEYDALTPDANTLYVIIG